MPRPNLLSEVCIIAAIQGSNELSCPKLLGLAETLRSELLLYSVSIHIFFPGTIYSPGFAEENKTKPEITLKIEESDHGLQPDQAAERLFQGRCLHICPE